MDSDHINRITHPETIAKLITKHFKARGRFCLSSIGGDCQTDSRMVDNDPHARYFLLDGLPPNIGTSLENEKTIEVRGAIDSIFSWFRTKELNPIIEDGERYYEIPYPRQLFQLQRREAFRVSLPATLTATLTGEVEDLDNNEMHPFRAMLANLSATGAAVIVTGKTASLMRKGTRLHHSRIRIPELLDIIVDAEVRNCRHGHKNASSMLGLEFLCLSTRDAQSITRVVMEIQRRALADEDD
ncbi:flagellar brake protein [Rhabdochromatium marinum]|uniref:flagellar brake protein n=1 Tax=Rhabdochromatium marinum TaxID=48729 RepID=UPI0019071200|nr:PilZ domain-containing protein [Rhabdochromatium marinum]MBK1647596.1 hypothetical protein [Rhabdochromatium marinum]